MTEAAPQSGALPVETTSFVGREREAGQVRHLLSVSRLVTLCGYGGVGKTRLALHAAHLLKREYDDARLVDLSGLSDPAAVAPAVAMTLGVPGEPTRSPAAAVAEQLGDRRLLLVLDNCEHVLDACAALADELLRAAPGVHLLVTSRQTLGITPEHTLVVPPLSAPEPETVLTPAECAAYDAIGLFVDRAVAALPGFELTADNAGDVASLCRRLDGLPLAIELAAVRLRALSVRQILERLDQRYELLTGGSRVAEPRQRTLRALIDWSYDRCSPEEQALWSRLSAFAGSVELEAAEEVCSDERLPRETVADLIAGLVEKSVLSREEHGGLVRYRLLETIAAYGRERLGDEETAVRRRHRDYYVERAERTEREWLRSWETRWWDRARLEQPNFRAALAFALTGPEEVEPGLRTAAALVLHWRALGLLTDGRDWLERLLAAGDRPTAARAKALWADAWLATLQGDFEHAEALLAESEAVGDRIGDAAVAAHVADVRGLAALLRGEPERAIAVLEESLARYDRIDEPVSRTLALHRLAQAALAVGDHQRAYELASECMARSEDDATWIAIYAQWVLGIATWRLGDTERAVALERAVVRNSAAYGDRLGVTLGVQTLAWIAAAAGQARRAARLLGAIGRTWQETGAVFAERAHLHSYQDECLRRLEADLGRDQVDGCFEQGRRLTQSQLVGEALEQAPEAIGASSALGLLTARELEIAQLVSQGLSNPDIARELVISPRTAETHVQHILGKLGFNSRTQIAVWVAEQRARAGQTA